MGTDIHCYLERFKDGKWEYVKEIELFRNDTLHSFFDTLKPGYVGLPPDISEEVKRKAAFWQDDNIGGFGFSFEDTKIIFDKLTGDILHETGVGLFDTLKALTKSKYKQRLIFWFDN